MVARRLVDDPRWKWVDGMLQVRGSERNRVKWTYNVGMPVRRAGRGPWLPALDDDATAGILLGMLRAFGDVRTWQAGTRHGVEVDGIGGAGDHLGEAAGLVLLACWATDENTEEI
jgi:hypothetical protein